MIVERAKISYMNATLEQLSAIVAEWCQLPGDPPTIPEVEWSKMRTLEFQEALRTREALARRLEGKQCILCQDFSTHVRLK